MGIILKIAFRNVLKNKRRSILIGLAVFICSFLLLLSNAAMNGVERQILRGYLNLQTAHVVVIWENLKMINPSESSRFVNVFENHSFDVDKDTANKAALKRLKAYLDKEKDQIRAIFPTIRRNGQLVTTAKSDTMFIVYGLVPPNKDFLLSSKTITMKAGELLSKEDYKIAISEEKAKADNLKIGDMVTVIVTTPYGAKNSLDFTVGGIYGNGAGYDNWYGFVSAKNARELFDFDPDYFDIGRIYLKDPNHAEVFAKDLDKYLISQSRVLRAESYKTASTFYPNLARMIKSCYSIFILFLLILIGVGLRSTIRMNLFERMKEFGTIRAIGFSRFQSYAIIFGEVFFLSFMALLSAILVSGVLVLILGIKGIYVGPGVMTYALGGESLYPEMHLGDLFFALIVIVFFALVSTLNPGLKICYQKITDLLVKRQQKLYPLFIWLRSIWPNRRLKKGRDHIKWQNI